MKRVGRVLHISPNRKALVKAERVPRIGEAVVDENRRPVGTVFDVLGPTVSPYVEVELKAKDPKGVVNSILYVSSSSKHKTGSRKRK